MTAANRHRIDRARLEQAKRSWKPGGVGRPTRQDFTHCLLLKATILATGYWVIRVLQGVL